MDDTISWLRDRPYYEGQIVDQRTVPGRDARTADCEIADRLAGVLEDQSITDLYTHQVDAIEAVRGGENVVLATETASGKSLAYTVPAFERALDRRATTLYVAPQVALINDQTETLSELAQGLGFASGVSVAQYTGRQSKSEKEAIRERQPTVLLTTPDMLHYGILPHAHRLWDWFFQRLETVVVDEVHGYRGVFGSHVSLVMRRLQRIAERFDAGGDSSESNGRRGDSATAGGPEWVCCSATIGNPVEHAAAVTGQPEPSFALVDEDASASGPRHWLLWNPPEYEGDGWGSGRRKSNHVETKQLFVDLVERGLQTVVFAGSRQTAERYASDSADELRSRGEHALADSVGAYQAALTDDRRRELEQGLQSGDLRGVWSTSALELGVDVGGLDAVLLDGYPGTRMRAFQQAGRAGRGTDPALVALVGGEDQLDQYVLRNPDALFETGAEQAVTNPENEQLLPNHVHAAACENWLSPDDDRHFGETFPDVVADLESAGKLDRRQTDQGMRWLGNGSPHHEMNLRTVDDGEVKLVANGDVIAKLSVEDALRDAYPGAIYHHQGRRYEVTDLDLDAGVAELDRTWADYFTRVLHDKTITVEADLAERRLPTREDVPVRFASVTMRKQITGYERRDGSSGEVLGQRSLDLPETTLETKALYHTVPSDIESEIRQGAYGAESDSGGGSESGSGGGGGGQHGDAATDGGSEPGDFPGSIHAAEHAMISMFPFEYLCDRGDIGGLSTPRHPHTGEPTIFIYDGYPGGIGLTRAGYHDIGPLMDTTLSMLTSCDCADGCPACVQSPHCGNANDPLDKHGAIHLLDGLVAQ
ncbi:ATP-dependent helicase [Haloarcula sp. CBA1115]|uniref:DEAD/DEAH box helicase n=1 Tax=unclassified Haloarcula TaxID=2624677 RepID=UPI0005955776|nr:MULTISPECIES: DEAD/DEAH box helicase [unclassified Haloarcula]AJF26198.1 ATP-dependent helicase [Haloarcula sp. CBA1115]